MHDDPISIPAIPTSRADWAGDQIRRSILMGEAKPGQRLINAEWALRLGISQTPLREAFQRLAAEGLVVFDPQRGARVAPITRQDAKDIYALRILLEPLAVSSSIAAGDAPFRAEITTAFEALDARYGDESAGFELVESHRSFHRIVRSRCTSAWLLRITELLADQSIRMQFASIGGRGGRRGARDEHRAIFEAAVALDAEYATRLTVEHLQRTLDALDAS